MKIPHRPDRMVGRWVVSLVPEIFYVSAAGLTAGGSYYRGHGLRGQSVESHCVTALSAADQARLNGVAAALASDLRGIADRMTSADLSPGAAIDALNALADRYETEDL